MAKKEEEIRLRKDKEVEEAIEKAKANLDKESQFFRMGVGMEAFQLWYAFDPDEGGIMAFKSAAKKTAKKYGVPQSDVETWMIKLHLRYLRTTFGQTTLKESDYSFENSVVSIPTKNYKDIILNHVDAVNFIENLK